MSFDYYLRVSTYVVYNLLCLCDWAYKRSDVTYWNEKGSSHHSWEGAAHCVPRTQIHVTWRKQEHMAEGGVAYRNSAFKVQH